MAEPAKSGVDAGAAPAGGAGGAANNASWADGLDADTKGWVSGKGFDKLDPAAALPELVKGWRSAEKTLGVPADQIIRLPGKDAKPEDWRAVWGKLGAPEKPEGYELKAPEGDSGEFLKTAAAWFHEIGVPKPMAGALAEKWNGYVAAQAEADVGRWNQRFDQEHNDLKAEWKNDYDKNIDLSKRVMKAFGVSQPELQAMERALGPKAFHMAFARFANVVGEHRFVGGEGGGNGFAMSAEGARARIIELGKDTAFQQKLMAKDADANGEWTRLHQIAFPEPVQA